MTKSLLIITLVLIILMIICPIVITAIVSKNSKEKDLFNKVIVGTMISGVIILVILLSFWITPLKNGDFSIKESSSNETTTSESVSLDEAGFNLVTMEEYLNLVKGSQKSIILVARPTCGYCEQFAPILKQAKDDLKLTVNYVNTDSFSSEEWTTFTNSLEYLNSENWGTPLVMIVQNGTTIAVNNGYVDLNTIKKFFEENGFGE